MDDEFKDLQRLLRLKRYETPPPEYFEDFLVDFHRRQRAELLKRPLWRLMLDRIEGAIPTFSPTRYAYAGACATAVAAAVIASSHILAGGPAGSTLAASTQLNLVPASTTFHPPASAVRVAKTATPRINIYASKPSLKISPELDFDRPRPATVSYASARPRGVLDTLPVSYEKPYSF